jgi:hypothetical protein
MIKKLALCFTVAAATCLAAPEDCDRICLNTAVTQYMNAVVKHDPAAAPLFVGFRQTENSVVVKLGTGTWKSVTGLGKLQRHYLDPVTGQGAYFGTVEEGADSAIVTVRVRVEHRKITEAEWMIARKGNPGLNGFGPDGKPSGNFFDPDNLAMNPPREKRGPKDARVSRDAMIAATNSYFDGITTHDGSIIMAFPGCTRIENGRTVTGANGRGGGTNDCTSGLATINIQNVGARRYPIADEEAGVVLALAVFIRKPGTTTRRNVFSEWFTIDENKIKLIHSAMYYPSNEEPVPNWPPFDGNWPLSPTLAPPPAAGAKK